MVTEEEYLKAKAIVEEYEEYEKMQGTIEAMYCVQCHAFDMHECFCDEEPLFVKYDEEDDECPYDTDK